MFNDRSLAKSLFWVNCKI